MRGNWDLKFLVLCLAIVVCGSYLLEKRREKWKNRAFETLELLKECRSENGTT